MAERLVHKKTAQGKEEGKPCAVKREPNKIPIFKMISSGLLFLLNARILTSFFGCWRAKKHRGISAFPLLGL